MWMRHARPGDLDRVEPLLERLRKIAGLREKSRGVFYRGTKAFLHFHEDDGSIYADARLGGDFERFPATTVSEQKQLVVAIVSTLGTSKSRP